MFRFRTVSALVLAASLIASSSALASTAKKKASPKPKAAAATQPDKELYDKAMDNLKHGHLDVARLQLQALLNTYPESEYQMKAKLAIGDSWYKAGDSASLTQAENEYKDFITFFPTAPEAAEAQMRVADIYFKQMDKPDRDFQKALRAEQEYRLMIQQFPDSPVVPQAKQRLREVQEVLAERQFEIGQFYGTRLNYPASIARLQTVIDAYPLFSKADLVLLSLGDDYMAGANRIRTLKGPEAMKAKLIKIYEDHAADDYARIVTRYPMEPRAADAKARLEAMHRPIPQPSAAELAENKAEIQSRAAVTLRSRALLLVSRKPEVLEASRVGEPDMETPKPTLAPEIAKQNVAIYNEILRPGSTAAATATADASAGTAPAAGDTAAPPRSDDPLKLEDVPNSDGTPSSSSSSTPSSSSGVGMSIISTGGGSASTDGSTARGAEPASSSVVSQPARAALPSVGPRNTALPAAEKPAEAPDQVNEVKNNGGTPTQSTAGKKKPKRPKDDKSDESSSKDKKKPSID